MNKTIRNKKIQKNKKRQRNKKRPKTKKIQKTKRRNYPERPRDLFVEKEHEVDGDIAAQDVISNLPGLPQNRSNEPSRSLSKKRASFKKRSSSAKKQSLAKTSKEKSVKRSGKKKKRSHVRRLSKSRLAMTTYHSGDVRVHRVMAGGNFVTVSDALVLFKSGSLLGKLIADEICKWQSAVFFECPPVSRSIAGQVPFEFALLAAPALDAIDADSLAFSEHFAACNTGDTIVSFTNLGGDAELIVPCPGTKGAQYAHLASFMQTAPISIRTKFWETVSNRISASFSRSNNPVWVSTSGLGVNWLHLRLDAHPKYYNHQPFKKWPRSS